MPRLTLSPRSRADMIEIWSYIADDSEAKADAFIDKLDAVLRMLVSNLELAAVAKTWLSAFEVFR